MNDDGALVKMNVDEFLTKFRAEQEADLCALVKSCASHEASLIMLKQVLQVLIELNQEVIDGIDLALKEKQC